MDVIKCDKCDKLKDKFFFYYIKMPIVYGDPNARLQICSQCFRKMWSVQIENERVLNGIKKWSNN